MKQGWHWVTKSVTGHNRISAISRLPFCSGKADGGLTRAKNNRMILWIASTVVNDPLSGFFSIGNSRLLVREQFRGMVITHSRMVRGLIDPIEGEVRALIAGSLLCHHFDFVALVYAFSFHTENTNATFSDLSIALRVEDNSIKLNCSPGCFYLSAEHITF
jgi:hypothetical protein